jgi:hypothetical protein
MELTQSKQKKRGHNDTVTIRYVSSKTWKWIMKRCAENIKGVFFYPVTFHISCLWWSYGCQQPVHAPISAFVLKCATLRSVICSLQMNIYIHIYSFSNVKTLMMSGSTSRDNGVHAGIKKSVDWKKKYIWFFLGASHSHASDLQLSEYTKTARK